MSELLERLRRLHGLREQKREDIPPSPGSDAPDGESLEYAAEEDDGTEASGISTAHIPRHTYGYTRPAHLKPQSLHEAVPGAVVETEAGMCYISSFAYPLSLPRGDYPLGGLLDHPPRILDQLVAVGIAGAERGGATVDYSQAAFIDTETSGLGSGSYCFMVGVGTFETLELPLALSSEPVEHLADGVVPDSGALSLHETAAVYRAAPPPKPESATHFVVRQFFMRHPGEETALLAALASLLEQYDMTVTFNGRSFDLPLLRSRYRLHRHFLPPSTPPPSLLDERRIHMDLLHPARRLWRRRLQSCRLINLEQKILNLHRSEDDVPGSLIPALYVDFTRNGDARTMRQVFYHNREDIVSMVGIATHLTTTLNSAQQTPTRGSSARRNSRDQATVAWEPTHIPSPNTTPAQHKDETADNPSPTLHGHEWLALGQHYARQNQIAEAVAALQQAAQLLPNPLDRALALSELAGLHKRAGDWEQACATWQLWISSVPGHDPTPYIELAKHCEWQSKDLAQAEMWTAWAFHNLQQVDERSHHRARLAEVEHRLQRIRRKRGSQ